MNSNVRERMLDYAERFNFDLTDGVTKMIALAFSWQDECDALRADAERIRQKLPEILGVLAGAASLCWEPRPTGVFDSSLASMFVDRALKECDAARKENPTTAADYPHGWHESAADNASKP